MVDLTLIWRTIWIKIYVIPSRLFGCTYESQYSSQGGSGMRQRTVSTVMTKFGMFPLRAFVGRSRGPLSRRYPYSTTAAPMADTSLNEEPEAKRRKLDVHENPSMNVDGDVGEKPSARGQKGKERRQNRRKPRVEAPKERAEGEEREGRLPKKMCAMLIGFCGSPFRGMQ